MEENKYKETTVGSLRISEEVIATIAALATKEIEGVAELAPKMGSIKNILGRSSAAKALKIELSDDVATIDVYVHLKYGTNIPDVASSIQNNVKSTVQNMTGIAVSKVNVNITGIAFEDAAGDAE